ncbi:MAG: DUF58 domain-containing protein [Polyangiales bacterium]
MPSGNPAHSSLLDPETVRALDRLRLELRRRVEGARAGDRRSTRRGASVEFAEHRPYAPGDDPRRVDWNVFSRLGELVVRLSVAEEDVTLHLLVDASRSMAEGEPSKLHRARRLAAALGYLCLTGSERVALTVTSKGAARPGDALRGRRRVGELLARLDALAPEGEAAMERAVDAVLSGVGRKAGVAVALTDFLDEAGSAQRAVRRLCAARHETVAVHLLSEAELSPPMMGEVDLVDSETGQALQLTVDDDALVAYRARLDAWVSELDADLRRRGARYVRAFGDRPELDVLTEALGARAGGRGWSS